MKKVKRKCLQMNPKQGRALQNIKTDHPDNFSINQNHLGPSQGPLTKFEKIRDFAIFRVRKSYLETPANISKVQLRVPISFQKFGALVETN